MGVVPSQDSVQGRGQLAEPCKQGDSASCKNSFYISLQGASNFVKNYETFTTKKIEAIITSNQYSFTEGASSGRGV